MTFIKGLVVKGPATGNVQVQGRHLRVWDASSSSFKYAKVSRWIDGTGTIQRAAYAPQSPASSDVTVVLYKNPGFTSPTDNDGYLKFTVNPIPAASGLYDVSWDFIVQYDNQTGNPDPSGRATGTVLTLGTDYTWSGGVLSILSDWVSPHQFAPWGSYKIVPKVKRNFDTSVPSPEYDAFRQAGDLITGVLYRYVDPRADQ